MAPGQKIPTEGQLARQFGASIGTVRRAQELLVREGLIVKQQGRGCFVADRSGQRSKVMWCCGLDVLGGDISSFYTCLMRACHREAEARAHDLVPVWLPPEQLVRVHQFCRPETAQQYKGVMFFGCKENHPLLNYARYHDWACVHLAQHSPGPKQVQVALDGAIAIGLRQFREHGHGQVTVLMCGQEPDGLMALAQVCGIRVELHVVDSLPNMSQIEAGGYHLMRRLLSEDACQPAILMLDDVVARGATRALVERQRGNRRREVVVAGSRQAMVPLGLDVTYLTHDTEELAREATRILFDQINGEATGSDRFVSRYDAFTDERVGTETDVVEVRPGAPI